jgi:gas vesicle protein
MISTIFPLEEAVGERKEHLKKLSQLSEKIIALGESIKKAEKDMQSVWMDQVERRDLQDVENHMKEVEEVLCVLKEEVGHIESSHCKEGQKKYGTKSKSR